MRCSPSAGITHFFTNSTESTVDADITHRKHAIIETVFADLIDGPLARIPSGRFGANSAWVICAAIAHNLLRATGTLAGGPHARARGATLRRKIINIPARLARPQRRPILHLPSHWPWNEPWLMLWHKPPGSPPAPSRPSPRSSNAATRHHGYAATLKSPNAPEATDTHEKPCGTRTSTTAILPRSSYTGT
jgi:hypothetical protein